MSVEQKELQPLKDKPTKKKGYAFASAALATTITLTALACNNETPANSTDPIITPQSTTLTDLNGDLIVNMGDYAIVQDSLGKLEDCVECANINADTKVEPVDKKLVDALIGVNIDDPQWDSWKDVDGDLKITCNDSRLVEKNMGKTMPFSEIDGMSLDKLRSGFVADYLILEVLPNTKKEDVLKFLDNNDLTQVEPQYQVDPLTTYEVEVEDGNLEELIPEIAQKAQEVGFVISIQRSFVARPISPIPSTPLETCD